MRGSAQTRARLMSLIAVLALARAVVACSSSDNTCVEGQIGTEQAPIIDGVNAAASDYDGVLKGVVSNRSCTVSRVGDRLLLMAAHCFTSLTPGGTLSLSRGASEPKFSQEVEVKNVTRHPSYTGESETAHSEFDVAVVELTAPLAASILIASVDTVPTRVGESLTLVGYGCDDFANDAGTGAGVRRFGSATVSQIYSGMVRTSGPAYACPGDSGGPAFRQGNAQRIVGVISSGDFAVEAGPSRSNLARLEVLDAWLRALSVTMFSGPPDASQDATADGTADPLDATVNAQDASRWRCVDGSLVPI